MFDSIVDSRQVRRLRAGSSSSQASGSSSRRTSAQDLEIARLQEALRQQSEYARAQSEYQRARDEYYANQLAQQQAFFQISLSSILFIATSNLYRFIICKY